MDQQPQQQSQQPEEMPVSELPVVPTVSETSLPQPSDDLDPQDDAALRSDPMGRPQEVQQDELVWQASEYVEHEKSTTWFVVLGVITLVLVALAIFLLQNYTFAVLLVVMSVAIVVWAKRPAVEMQYRLSGTGVWVNDKFFALHDFRGFGVLQDGAVYAVVLLPIKRFSPGVTVYFPHELGEQIVDVLGAALPMEDMEPDWIDKLTRRLNF